MARKTPAPGSPAATPARRIVRPLRAAAARAGGEPTRLPTRRCWARRQRSTLAVNPLIGIRAADFAGAATALAGAAVREPARAARHLGRYARALGQAARGAAPPRPIRKDKRFADPAWRSNAVPKRLLQAHAATAQELERYIDATA